MRAGAARRAESRHHAHLIEIDALDQASILRHAVATGVVMVTYPLTARHRDVGPIHALTETVGALSPRQSPDLQDLAVKPGS